VRWDTVLRAAALRFGVTTRFGASTMTPGSEVAERVAVCEIAVPPGPHINSAIDALATARLEENLMAISSRCAGSKFHPAIQGIIS
jgi:hypothetical protein